MVMKYIAIGIRNEAKGMNKKHKALVPVLGMSLILTGVSASIMTTSATAATKIKVTYIPKNLGNPYFDAIVKGFNTAAKGLNMTVKVVAPAQAGATDQIHGLSLYPAGCRGQLSCQYCHGLGRP